MLKLVPAIVDTRYNTLKILLILILNVDNYNRLLLMYQVSSSLELEKINFDSKLH